MPDVIQIQVYENKQLACTEELPCPVELGRQGKGEGEPFSKTRVSAPGQSDFWRLIIARRNEDTVSRRQAWLETLPSGKLRLKNLSEKSAIHLQDGGELKPKCECEIQPPALLTLGNKTVRIQDADDGSGTLHALPEVSMAPGAIGMVGKLPAAFGVKAPSEVEWLAEWLNGAMDVLQSATNSSDFFRVAARTVVDLVGLDSGRVLLWEQADWKTEAVERGEQTTADLDQQPSRRVLNSVRQEKRTFWEVPGCTGHEGGSLVGIGAVVAAPILNRNGNVIGALYGHRRGAGSSATEITKLEAMLVKLLAGGVAAGLARLEQERAAMAAQVQFEQFFTAELAAQLVAQPDLLQGRDCEVTVLFCDIRGFSRMSENLGPAKTVEWITDVLGVLSDCVLAHQGVLVDYIGDELLAMWGAPKEQPDHARLACRAALDMLCRLPQVNERWQPILQEPTALGIGINTGIARVGNTGSQRKFKYGPLGNMVNLASRIQGATKYLKTKLLISRATHSQLDAEYRSRRLCKVSVVNITEPVDLYELAPPGSASWPELQQEYEAALAEFEQKNFGKTSRILGNLLGQHPDDGPSLVLLSRAVNALVADSPEFDPVWELPGK